MGTRPLVRKVSNIQRTLSGAQAIFGANRILFVDPDIVDTMPTDGPDEVELHYFALDGLATDEELALEFQRRNLRPDPRAQAADNEQNRSFADSCPNGGHWKNTKGEWCYFACTTEGARRVVFCGRADDPRNLNRQWNTAFRFAGVLISL